jgi:hypothetical protein
LCPARAAQPEAAELEDALEMSEQHLDAFAVATRLLEGLGFAERTSRVASIFIDAARDLAPIFFLGTKQLNTWLTRRLRLSPVGRSPHDGSHRSPPCVAACSAPGHTRPGAFFLGLGRPPNVIYITFHEGNLLYISLAPDREGRPLHIGDAP